MQLDGGLPQHFADQMGALLGPDFPKQIGLAVSGGGDSMALLHLAAGWARIYGIVLRVVTIDHGLRDASAAEAGMVKDEATALGLDHDTLVWRDWDGDGNLQDAARNARRTLINDWRGACRHVLMAHTQDDQAETLLMRLARGSGVEGLSAMAPRHHADGYEILRPLLDVTRSALRHYLTTLRIPFVDDPSNLDETYGRVRIRKLIGQEGLDLATLAQTAQRMRRARVALARRAYDAAQQCLATGNHPKGTVVFKRDAFATVEIDTQLRILATALQFVAGATYRPRLAPLEAALDRILAGGATTLHGCVLICRKDTLFIAREFAAVAGVTATASSDVHWDGTWQFSGPEINGLTIKALGENGLAQLRKAKATMQQNQTMDRLHGIPGPVLAGLPALWDGETLIAFDFADFGPEYSTERSFWGHNFADKLLTH